MRIHNAGLETGIVVRANKRFGEADSLDEIWEAWSAILDHGEKAFKAIRNATCEGATKAWSDALLHKRKSDPILQYAAQFRDYLNHSHDKGQLGIPRRVNVPFLGTVSEATDISFYGNVCINEHGISGELPSGNFDVRSGRIVSATIPKDAFQEEIGFLLLEEIVNRGRRYPVPNPKTPRERQAREIADHLQLWLETSLSEAKKLAEA